MGCQFHLFAIITMHIEERLNNRHLTRTPQLFHHALLVFKFKLLHKSQLLIINEATRYLPCTFPQKPLPLSNIMKCIKYSRGLKPERRVLITKQNKCQWDDGCVNVCPGDIRLWHRASHLQELEKLKYSQQPFLCHSLSA